VAVLALGMIGAVEAANEVTTTSGASIVLPSDGSSYTLSTNTTVQSFTVNNSSIDFIVEANSVIYLTSSDRKNFTVNNSQCGTSLVCGASASNIYISCSSAVTQHTITLTPSGTCSSQNGGGSSSSSGSSSSPAITPSATPVIVTPVIPAMPAVAPAAPSTTVAPSASVTAPAPSTSVQPASVVEFSHPESAVQIKGLTSPVFQQGSRLKFSFEFKNENTKTIPVKVTRQLLDGNGKVVKSSVLSTNLKANKILKKNATETISKTLSPGDYIVVIKIVNSKTKELLEENGFKITVEKLKKKYFVLAEETPIATAIAFDQAVWNKIKTNIVLPANFKFKYSFTNNTEQKQTVRMVRELIGPNEKVISKSSGKWVMTPGEKDSLTPTQAVAGNLTAGAYIVKISALDWKTKEILAENQFGFVVELK